MAYTESLIWRGLDPFLQACGNGRPSMVLVAMDGASALERMQRRRPDVVLLDAVMPGLDGLSPRTVNKHQEHVYVKLGVETRTAVATLAIAVCR